jgi:hypothetical protein
METETRAVEENGDEHHVVLHVEQPENNCHCGRGPKRRGGAGNCLTCHREIQQRYREKQRKELLELRKLVGGGDRQ